MMKISLVYILPLN